MDGPLSPLFTGTLNVRNGQASKSPQLEVRSLGQKSITAKQEDEIIVWDDPPSSPFMTEVAESRNASCDWNKAAVDPDVDAIFEEASILPASSPAKAAVQTHQPFDFEMEKENEANNYTTRMQSPPPVATPARNIPSPEKPSLDSDTFSMPPPSTAKRAPRPSARKTNSFADSQSAAATPLARHKEGLDGMVEQRTVERTVQRAFPISYDGAYDVGDETNIDDTCFSTFSAVPDMTLFARLGEAHGDGGGGGGGRRLASPQKETIPATPRTSRKRTSSSRSPSPTPRRQKSSAKEGNTTSLLLDFTQQIESYGQTTRQSPTRSGGLSPSRTEPNLASHLRNQRSPQRGRMSEVTPAKQSSLLNLLDFELPPPPTPRSAPAFTIREVESMKSSYLSQISSIKAKLSGREAEVESLKKALEDAENRAGEAQELSRDDRLKREQAEQEKADWEKRGQDVENVLKCVKEEVLKGEAEKEALAQRAENVERRIDELEAQNSDLQAKNLDSQARLLPAQSTPRRNADGTSAPGVSSEEIQRLVQAQLDQKVEAVSRELHAVYKKKHETKVATLKKSYEARSEKRCAELQTRVEDLDKLNGELLAAKEATLSNMLSANARGDDPPRHTVELEEQKARLAGLTEELRTARSEQTRLHVELERERVEKGELVAAVDEMLALQSTDAAPAALEDFRKSIHRPSGLRAPNGFGAAPMGSRIGKGGMTGASRADNSKSKMMNNIERMGNGRGFE